MDIKRIIVILLIISIALPFMFFYPGEDKVEINEIPLIEIIYPRHGATVSKIITISGIATDPDGDDSFLEVEIMMGDEWTIADGNGKWSYEWRTYDVEDGYYTIYARSWDGSDYSEVVEIEIEVDNRGASDFDAHKWAIFIAAYNFPENNESKLGNGALNLAEFMVSYFVEDFGYPVENIYILFDDGWIRKDNGYGEPIMTLQEREHEYDITYGAATRETVVSTLEYIIEEANNFDDSEVFIWIASHGSGDQSKKLFGGKILERSAIFLWDEILTDKDLGDLLSDLRSDKTCIVVDACYSGGFADKTIFNLPELFILKSNIPDSGRVVITGTSKFRVGWSNTVTGPLFTQLWFEGIITGDADGFRPSIADTGRPTRLKLFKDGEVSVEEAFYYARYTLKKDKNLDEYDGMQPQINDQYPKRGIFGSLGGLVIGK